MCVSSHKDSILNFLFENKKQCCDDCLSKLLKIEPRQTIYQVCSKLNKNDIIKREKAECSSCQNIKTVSSLSDISKAYVSQAPVKPNPIKDTHLDLGRLTFDEFERRVQEFLQNHYKDTFREKELQVGEGKLHKFDLVNSDNSIVVECKSYKWTDDDNYPSAKISTAHEALFFLSRIRADKKVLVFQDSFNSKRESLVEVFVRRSRGLFDDTDIWIYHISDSIENDEVEIVYEDKDIWYKKLYNL